MNPTVRRSSVFLIILALSLAASPVGAESVPGAPPSLRKDQPCLSMELPPDHAWNDLRPGEMFDVLYGTTLKPNHTWVIGSWVRTLPESITSMDQLRYAVGWLSGAVEFERLPKRFRILDRSFEADTSGGMFASTYRIEVEDRDVPGMGGRSARLLLRGWVGSHPDARALMHVSFSERVPMEPPSTADATMDRFFTNLRVRRVPDALSPVTSTPDLVSDVTQAFRSKDALWVITRHGKGDRHPSELVRMDPVTLNVVARTPVGSSPICLRVDERGVEVGDDGDGTVRQFDPVTLAPRHTAHLGRMVARMTMSEVALWATNPRESRLWQVDRADGTAKALKVKGLRKPLAILLHDGALWVSDNGERLLVVDPDNGEPLAPPIGVGPGPRDLVSGGGAIWVLCYSMRAVQRIDPETYRVTATIPLPGTSHLGMDFHADAVWVSSAEDGMILRVDANTHEVSTVPVGLSCTVAAGHDGLWITDIYTERIGRLRPELLRGLPRDTPVLTSEAP